jgi:hypothetical protein
LDTPPARQRFEPEAVPATKGPRSKRRAWRVSRRPLTPADMAGKASRCPVAGRSDGEAAPGPSAGPSEA